MRDLCLFKYCLYLCGLRSAVLLNAVPQNLYKLESEKKSMKSSWMAVTLVALVALVSLTLVFMQSGVTAEVTGPVWHERYYTQVECPTACYDEKLKVICLVDAGSTSWGGYCYGKPQISVTAKCSCPVLTPEYYDGYFS